VWQRYIALGDSFTEGLNDPLPGQINFDSLDAKDQKFLGWADRLAVKLSKYSPDLLYANLAVRGRLLSDVIDTQLPQALAMKPDLISIGAGINDALRPVWDPDQLARLYDHGVKKAREAGVEILLVGFGDPVYRGVYMAFMSNRFARLNADVCAIASRYGARIVNFWPATVYSNDHFWSEDRLHLNSAGHEAAAEGAMHALGFTDNDWLNPNFELPTEKDLLERAAMSSKWFRKHALPWVLRRAQGRSSGDGVLPKRPQLTPVDDLVGVYALASK
jgi:lysophospholipase L1-like esterase